MAVFDLIAELRRERLYSCLTSYFPTLDGVLDTSWPENRLLAAAFRERAIADVLATDQPNAMTCLAINDGKVRRLGTDDAEDVPTTVA